MSTKASKLKEFIRNLIRQELKELEEVSVTGNLDGGEGPPRTPYAFYGGRKKDKEKKKRIAQAGGYMKVKESVNEGKYHQYRNDETMTPKQKFSQEFRSTGASL